MVVTAQFLLLSVQITRSHNVRLIRYWAVTVFDPFQRSLHGLLNFSSSAYTTYGHLWHAQQENQELHAQLVTAESQIQRLTEQAGEAQRLRNLLELQNQLAFQTVAAEVIATSPGENSNAIFIDKVRTPGSPATLPSLPRKAPSAKSSPSFPIAHRSCWSRIPSGPGVTLSEAAFKAS